MPRHRRVHVPGVRAHADVLHRGLRATSQRRRQRPRNELTLMPSRHRALAVFFALLANSVVLPAAGQPAPGGQPPPAGQPPPGPDKPAPNAQELRDKARAALSSGDVAGACVLFEQTYEASKTAGSGVSTDDALFDLA